MRLLLGMLLLLSGCVKPAPRVATPSDVEEPVVLMGSTTQVERLNAALGEGLSVTKAYAVRSKTHDWAHYIAARVHGAPAADAVGLWFMEDGMDVPGDGYSVNDVARSVSSLPPFTDVAPDAPDAHPEVQALLAFTRGRP